MFHFPNLFRHFRNFTEKLKSLFSYFPFWEKMICFVFTFHPNWKLYYTFLPTKNNRGWGTDHLRVWRWKREGVQLIYGLIVVATMVSSEGRRCQIRFLSNNDGLLTSYSACVTLTTTVRFRTKRQPSVSIHRLITYWSEWSCKNRNQMLIRT